MRGSTKIGLEIGAPLLLFCVSLFLGLTLIREKYFNSVPLLQFLALVWTAFSAPVAVAPALAPIYRAVKAAVTGKELRESPAVSLDRLILTVIRAVTRLLRQPRASIPIAFILLAADLYGVFVLVGQPEPQSPPSSVVATKVGEETFIYVADRETGRLLVYQQSNLAAEPFPIPIGTHGNIHAAPGQPLNMIDLNERDRHLIFVTDIANNNVHVIDARTNTEVGDPQPAGKVPNSLAITRDHKRLLVSSEQPVLNGSVTVFAIDKQRLVFEKTIRGVNCPEAFAVSPRGHRAYLATQCGGGQDPVFVIDTANASVSSSIPNLAVGISIAISTTGDRLYVGRGDYHAHCDASLSNQTGSAVSVVNTRSHEIERTFCLRAGIGPVAVSRDRGGTYLVVANSNWLTVFDRESMSVLNDIQLEGGISGIGVEGTSVFAYIPSSRHLYLTNLSGLKP
jgi:hypothetical protein